MTIHSAKIFVPGPGDGQSGTLTLPGSGIAVPAGLDAVLEYNGLLMNVQKNIDRYRVTTIDGLYDADVRDTRDVNTNDDGEVPYNAFYGGRTIVIGGTIETYSVPKLRDMQQALRAAFVNIRNEYPLYFRTGNFQTDHYINCKKISSISGVEQQTNIRANRDFQVSLRASNPRFLSYYQKNLDILPPVPVSSSNPYALTIAINIGNYFSQPIYRIWGPTTVGVTIINDDTGESFEISGSIAYDDYVDFDTAKRSLKNSVGNNLWNLLTDDSDYVGFQGVSDTTDGNNHLFYYGDSPRIQISWQDSWI